MMRAGSRRPRSESGMSLVELIVAMGVSALLLGVIAAIFGQGLLAQQQQTARDSATGKLNVASSFLNESLRNGVAARVLPSDPTRIDVKVRMPQYAADGTETSVSYECRAWVIADNQIWYSHGAAPRGVFSASSGWTSLISQVQSPASGGAVGFTTSGSGKSFNYFFNVKEGDVEVAVRDGGYLGIIEPAGDPLTCW